MIKRYDFQEGNEETIIECVECSDGDWVAFDDYDKLRKDKAEMEAQVLYWKVKYNEIQRALYVGEQND